MIAHKLLVSHRQRYEYGLHKLTWGRGAGGARAGSQHHFFVIKVLQFSMAEISNLLPTSHPQDAVYGMVTPLPEQGTGQGSPSCKRPREWMMEVIRVVLCWQWVRAQSLVSPATGWTGRARGKCSSLQK